MTMSLIIIQSIFHLYHTNDSVFINSTSRTLGVRMQKHMENGLAVAKFLETHPLVRQVQHPGLSSHPQHEVLFPPFFESKVKLPLYIKIHIFTNIYA